MEALRTISTLLPLALTSGINLYATLVIVGLSIRLGWVTNYPTGLDAVGSWPVIIVAGVFYLVEFLADKIPVVDNVWDMIHTFIRPIGAALVSFAVISKMDPVVAVLAALAAGGIALVSHGGKSGTRMAVNLTSPAENVTNIIVSLAEDIGVGVLSFTALKYPYVAVIVAMVIFVLILLLVPRLLSWSWFNFSAMLAGMKSAFYQIEDSETLPASHLTALAHQIPELSARCKAQGIRKANGRSGYLNLSEAEITFTYDTISGGRAWRLPLEKVAASYRRQKLFLDILEIHFLDNKKDKTVRFVFMKDRLPLYEAAANRVSAVSVR